MVIENKKKGFSSSFLPLSLLKKKVLVDNTFGQSRIALWDFFDFLIFLVFKNSGEVI